MKNESRSMSADLREGATDGRYRKARPDTVPGVGDAATKHTRAGLHPYYNYGYINQETGDKVVGSDMR